MNFDIPQVVRHKPTGNLLITRQRYPKNQHHGSGYICQPIDNRYMTQGYADDDLEIAPPRKPGGFDYKTEIVPRVQGSLPWTHMEPANLAQTLSNIAACAGWTVYPDVGFVQKPGDSSQTWARFFLHRTQGAEYTGEAHAIIWSNGPYRKPQNLIDAVVEAAVQSVHDVKTPAGNIAAAVLALESARATESAMPTAWLLSICKHEIIDSSTAQGRMHGWHPACCSKCGIDLSVDSSD
jgi:hypothetical protein